MSSVNGLLVPNEFNLYCKSITQENPIPGPTGPAGPTGDAGAIGPTGPTGPTGAAGAGVTITNSGVQSVAGTSVINATNAGITYDLTTIDNGSTKCQTISATVELQPTTVGVADTSGAIFLGVMGVFAVPTRALYFSMAPKNQINGTLQTTKASALLVPTTGEIQIAMNSEGLDNTSIWAGSFSYTTDAT